MKRPSLYKLAETDRQIARFLTRAQEKAAGKMGADLTDPAGSTGVQYQNNHLIDGYDFDDDTVEAIDRCILP